MITKQQLMPFCADPQKEHRKFLHEPFIKDEYVFASDAYYLIRIPLALVNTDGIKEWTNIHIPPLVNNTSIPFNKEKFVRFLDETEEKKDKFICPDCNGTGEIKVQHESVHYCKTIELTIECPVCAGKGEIKTTNLQSFGIHINGTTIHYLYNTARKVMDALELTDIPSLKVTKFGTEHNRLMTLTDKQDISVSMAGILILNGKEGPVYMLNK